MSLYLPIIITEHVQKRQRPLLYLQIGLYFETLKTYNLSLILKFNDRFRFSFILYFGIEYGEVKSTIFIFHSSCTYLHSEYQLKKAKY